MKVRVLGRCLYSPLEGNRFVVAPRRRGTPKLFARYVSTAFVLYIKHLWCSRRSPCEENQSNRSERIFSLLQPLGFSGVFGEFIFPAVASFSTPPLTLDWENMLAGLSRV